MTEETPVKISYVFSFASQKEADEWHEQHVIPIYMEAKTPSVVVMHGGDFTDLLRKPARDYG